MPHVKKTALPSIRGRRLAICSSSHGTGCTLAGTGAGLHALVQRCVESWEKSLAKRVWWNDFRADFLEPWRRFRIARHRPLHLVSKGAARPVRREFPEIGKLYIE